jgi:UDP-N-acetylglucosamine 4,6-dehydratase
MTSLVRSFLSPKPNLNDASILVTGGTGSFGKAFVQSVLQNFKARKTIIFSRDELKQHDMQQDPVFQNQSSLRFFIGDVRDQDRLEMAMRDVDFVIHAAALKQVPAAEYNPMECINTNVMGAENVVKAAIRSGVSKVIALSTDKAASPINLYGASKLASDKIFVAANNLSAAKGTKFSIVRYGNVINSRGSVVPLFRKLINDNTQSLPITDPAMTRFWITLDQGINFVLSSLAMMRGGEIFIPKISSMKISEMASAMAPGLAQHTIGIRPGEKLHEIMITPDDARMTLELDDRYIIKPSFQFWSEESFSFEGAKPVPDKFSYRSEANSEWLDADGFMNLIK